MKTPITSIPFLIVVLLVSTTLSAVGSNYYVDPSSWGSNRGTLTDPWKSIDDIPWYVNYFSPGDTVFFKRGLWYSGTLSINSSGSSSAPIVFMPYGSGYAPVFQYNLANPTEQQIYDRTIIRLNQANYVVIDGFELKDASMSEIDHNLSANVGYGVYMYNSSHSVIKNVTISRLGAGVAIDGGSHNTITDCNISNLRMIINTPGIMWDDFGANGIIVKGSDNTITHNDIQECWAPSYDYHIDGGAIEMYGAVSNNKILYNKASENLGFMEFGSGSGGQALNNVIGYNLLINNGIIFWLNTEGVYGLDVRNVQFYNNNIVETHAPRIADMRNMIGISATPTVSNVLIMKNNIFWLTTSSNITDPVAQPFNGQQLIHQNNLFHMGGGSLGYTLDPTEQNLNPAVSLFTDITTSGNPASWNYNLQPAATAINYGQVTGIDKDFYGQAVPFGGAPDAGIAESIAIILPLQFISSNGWGSTNGNNLEWVTTTDPADHFEIEKSNSGSNFKKIADVPYKTNTGATTVKYQFVDKDAKDEIAYYRIKAVEPGNTVSYSQVISIKNNISTNNIIVSPNPARDYLYLRAPGTDFHNKEMVLVTISGVEIKRARIDEAGSQIKINVSMMPRGVYVIKLIDHKTGKCQSTMFTK